MLGNLETKTAGVRVNRNDKIAEVAIKDTFISHSTTCSLTSGSGVLLATEGHTVGTHMRRQHCLLPGLRLLLELNATRPAIVKVKHRIQS